LDELVPGQEYLDPASEALTRAAWAKLKNGEVVLLGFAIHDLGNEDQN
jgi:hypothetical protein